MEQIFWSKTFKHNIKGYVKEGYEPVLHLFESYFESGHDRHS